MCIGFHGKKRVLQKKFWSWSGVFFAPLHDFCSVVHPLKTIWNIICLQFTGRFRCARKYKKIEFFGKSFKDSFLRWVGMSSRHSIASIKCLHCLNVHIFVKCNKDILKQWVFCSLWTVWMSNKKKRWMIIVRLFILKTPHLLQGGRRLKVLICYTFINP